MQKTSLTIRARLLIVIGILNVLIAVLLGSQVYKAAVRFSHAQTLKEGSLIIDVLYDVNKSLSLERADSLSVMYAGPETASFLQEDLLKSRDEADKGLTAALSQLRNNQAPDTAAAVNKVEEKYRLLQKLRQDLDAALTRPIAMRDLTISDRFFKTSTGLIADIQKLILIHAGSFQNIDAAVGRKMIYKYFVWDLAEYAGEEYAIIGKLIVEDKHPTPEQQEQLLSLRERIQYGWEIIRKFSFGGDLEKQLMSYMEEAETHYFFTFDQIKDLFYGFKPISASAGYPLSIEIWLGMASQAVDSLLTLQDEVLKETQRHVDLMQQRTEQDIIVSLLVLGSSIALSLYCWSVIVFRVTRPVNAMVNTLYRATREGDKEDLAGIDKNQDEIAKLARVLEVFQTNTRRMKQSNEELERYAYITAHDLKSPLRAIDNLSQWIEEDLEGVLTGKAREYMTVLRQRVRRMEKLLNDTLEYSKLDAGTPLIRDEIVNGRTLLQDIISMVAPPIGFTITIGNEFANISVNRFPLQQVFYNLISNAIKHHDKDTGIVAIQMRETETHYIFTVSDDGPGIPSEYHEKIFEMFQTLKPRDQKEGSGMGLAFVKKILTTSGNSIRVESEPGKGSVFRFTWLKSIRAKGERDAG